MTNEKFKTIHEAILNAAKQGEEALTKYLSTQLTTFGYCYGEEFNTICKENEEVSIINLYKDLEDAGIENYDSIGEGAMETILLYDSPEHMFKDICFNICTINLHAGCDDTFCDYTPGATLFIMEGLTRLALNPKWQSHNCYDTNPSSYQISNAIFTMFNKLENFFAHPELHDLDENDGLYNSHIELLRSLLNKIKENDDQIMKASVKEA